MSLSKIWRRVQDFCVRNLSKFGVACCESQFVPCWHVHGLAFDSCRFQIQNVKKEDNYFNSFLSRKHKIFLSFDIWVSGKIEVLAFMIDFSKSVTMRCGRQCSIPYWLVESSTLLRLLHIALQWTPFAILQRSFNVWSYSFFPRSSSSSSLCSFSISSQYLQSISDQGERDGQEHFECKNYLYLFWSISFVQIKSLENSWNKHKWSWMYMNSFSKICTELTLSKCLWIVYECSFIETLTKNSSNAWTIACACNNRAQINISLNALRAHISLLRKKLVSRTELRVCNCIRSTIEQFIYYQHVLEVRIGQGESVRRGAGLSSRGGDTDSLPSTSRQELQPRQELSALDHVKSSRILR